MFCLTFRLSSSLILCPLLRTFSCLLLSLQMLDAEYGGGAAVSRGGRGALARARRPVPLQLAVCGGGEGCAAAGWEGGVCRRARPRPEHRPPPSSCGPRGHGAAMNGGRGALAQAQTESLHLAVRGGGDGFAAAGGFLIVVFFLRHSHSSSFPIVSFFP